MLTIVDAKKLDGCIDPRHEVQLVCSACGYDLDEHELKADTCSDCGAVLKLQQNVRIFATSVPAASGSTLV